MQNVQNAPRQPPVAGEVLSPLPHPRLTPKKPYLPAAVASVRRFRGQLATERIVAVYRPSLLFALGPSIPVAIGLFGLVLWHRATNPGQAATFLTSLVLVLISAPLAFRFVFTWLGRLYILTDERVLVQTGIIHQKIDQLELAHAGQVLVVVPNIFEVLVGLGTVKVASTSTTLRLLGVSHARQLADEILLMKEQSDFNRAAHPDKPVVSNHRLQVALDALEPPAAPPVFVPPAPVPLGGFLHRQLTVQLFQNESFVELVYRHWIMLVRREVPGVALAGLTILAFMIARSTATSTTAPLLVILVGVVVTLVYVLLAYMDWADDVFVLTSHRLVDIDRLFLIMVEYSNATHLTQIQDVRVDQGFWGQVFGYGSLIVETGNKDHPLEMRNMADPRGLMNRIFALVERAHRRTVNRQRHWQRRDASVWLSEVLDDLLLQVPDLTNLPILRAAAQARKAGLRLTVDGERPAPGLASGIVLEQTPSSGALALAEDTVRVVISGRSHP